MLGKLRIIVAAICLLATACFAILWIRSASNSDSITYFGLAVGSVEVASIDGRLIVPWSWEFTFPEDQAGFFLMTERSPRTDWRTHFQLPAWESTPWSHVAFIPYWFLIMVNCGIVCLLIEKPFRFSLRTLAIAATLIAITLGLGVLASRPTF